MGATSHQRSKGRSSCLMTVQENGYGHDEANKNRKKKKIMMMIVVVSMLRSFADDDDADADADAGGDGEGTFDDFRFSESCASGLNLNSVTAGIKVRSEFGGRAFGALGVQVQCLEPTAPISYMVSGPGPPPPGRAAPAPSGPAQPERTHANQREGGRWRMIPASASSQERRTASEQGQGHRLQGEKSNIIFCMVTST